jgi:antirestriction protein
MENPKIYVADLAAYNEGKLIGEWLDLSDYSDGAEVMEAITELMEKFSKEQGVEREEWAIHDTENIPDDLASEYMGEKDFDKIIAIMKIAEDLDIPYEVISEYASNVGMDIEDLGEIPFNGRYDSEEDFARDLVEQGVITDLGQYLEMTALDMRLLAQEEADSRVDDMDDDDLLSSAGLEDDFVDKDAIRDEISDLETDISDLEKEIEDADEEYDESDTEEERDDIEEKISLLKEDISEKESELSEKNNELDSGEDKDDVIEKAKEQLREEYYDDIYDQLSIDAVGYFIDELGYEESSLADNNLFMVDYKALASDLSSDYTFIEHDGDVYVFASYKNGGVTYAKGGTTFKEKASSISKSLLKRKKVAPAVQKDYGKTYNKKEAVDSAKRIAGAMRAKEMTKGKSKI